MGSGGDFLLGATAGVLGTIEGEYDRQAKERALIATEDRMVERQKASELRALENQKKAEARAQANKIAFTEWNDAHDQARASEEREREIERLEGGTDPGVIRASKESEARADVEVNKQRTLKKEGLGTYRPRKGSGTGGMTAASARTAFNGALADITGVTETAARPDDKRRSRLQDFAKAENGEDVYNLITGEVTVTEGKWNPLKDNVDVREADRKMGAALKELRDEVVWTVGRTERAKLDRASKNNVLDSNNVYAMAQTVAMRADAGIETVRNGLTRIRESGPPNRGSREDFYKFLRGELYESMGYEVDDPTAIAAKKLWNVYENGLNAAY